MVADDLQHLTPSQRAGRCYGVFRNSHPHAKSDSAEKEKSAHPGEDQYAEDVALARKERYRSRLKDLLARYGKKAKDCGGQCACADCTEKDDDDEGEGLDYKAMEAEEDKSVLAPSPHHPVSAGRRAVAGSIMTPRQRLNHYDSGKKEWTFEAKPGEPLEVVGYEQHGGMRVRNKKGQEAVIGEHNLRFVRHPRGHKEPKQTGREEPYHRDKPEGGSGGGTCKPGQTASETGCSPKSLAEGYGIVRKNTKDDSGHEHGIDGKFTGHGGGSRGAGGDSRPQRESIAQQESRAREETTVYSQQLAHAPIQRLAFDALAGIYVAASGVTSARDMKVLLASNSVGRAIRDDVRDKVGQSLRSMTEELPDQFGDSAKNLAATISYASRDFADHLSSTVTDALKQAAREVRKESGARKEVLEALREGLGTLASADAAKDAFADVFSTTPYDSDVAEQMADDLADWPVDEWKLIGEGETDLAAAYGRLKAAGVNIAPEPNDDWYTYAERVSASLSDRRQVAAQKVWSACARAMLPEKAGDDSTKSYRSKASFFSECDRDDAGHCKPGTDGASGGSSESESTAAEKQSASSVVHEQKHLDAKVREKLSGDIAAMEKTPEGKETLARGESLASKIKDTIKSGVEAALSAIDAESKGGISLIAGGLASRDARSVYHGADQLFGAVFQCVHEEIFENALAQHSVPGAHALGMVASSLAVKAEQGLLKAVAWAWAKTTGQSEKAGLVLSRKADHELTEADNELLDALAKLAADALGEITGGEVDGDSLREKIQNALIPSAD